MRTIKTSGLTGIALDWAVAKCEGLSVVVQSGVCHDAELIEMCVNGDTRLIYSTDWAQGGPIIEREKIAIDFDGATWCASDNAKPAAYYGQTPLIAAMRCYVASKLGDTVEIPEELT